MTMNEEQEKLLEELSNYAYDIRCDWSDFDGRDLLKYINEWIPRFRKASLSRNIHKFFDRLTKCPYCNERFKGTLGQIEEDRIEHIKKEHPDKRIFTIMDEDIE